MQRAHNATVRNTTRRRRNRTLTHRTQRTDATQRNTTLTQSTQHERNRTQHRDATQPGTQLEGRTQIRDGTPHLSNARNTRGGGTRDRGTQHAVAARYCGQLRKRLTPNHKLEATMEGHSNPPDVLFAFRVLNSRAKATQRRNIGDYKKTTLDCGFQIQATAPRHRAPSWRER